jgi:hypothetical protein
MYMLVRENRQGAYRLPGLDCEKEIQTLETEKKRGEMLQEI